MSKVITELDCSGETSYELGTVYEVVHKGEKKSFVFGYNDGVTQEDVEKYNIEPGWTEVGNNANVLLCGSPLKKETTLNKNYFLALALLGIATIGISQFFKN